MHEKPINGADDAFDVGVHIELDIVMFNFGNVRFAITLPFVV